MSAKFRAVVFSDADSAFEGANPEEWRSAARVLNDLRQGGVAVVICSMKSHAELEQIQEFLGSAEPCVVERGAAVVIPDGYFPESPHAMPAVRGYRTIEFGLRREAVRAALYRITALEQIDIVALDDLSLEETAFHYGVPLLRARQIRERGFSERFRPLNPTPSVQDRLLHALRAAGMECTVDDKFWQVDASPGLGPALACLRALYANVPSIVCSSNVTDLQGWVRTLATIALEITDPDEEPAASGLPILE